MHMLMLQCRIDFVKVCEELESIQKMNLLNIKFNLAEAFKGEFIYYLLYIATLEGEIGEQEKDFINLTTSMQMSTDTYNAIACNKNFNDGKFAKEIPSTLQLAYGADAALHIFCSLQGEKYNPVCDKILHLYGEAGTVIATLDGDLSENEKQRISAYINMMSEGAQEWYEKEQRKKQKQEDIQADNNMALNTQNEMKTQQSSSSENKDSKNTLSWSKFVDRYCSDSTVEDMISEGICFLIDRSFNDNNVLYVLQELQSENNRYFVLNELFKNGYIVTEGIIREWFESEGENNTLSILLSAYKGDFSKSTVMAFAECGCEDSTMEIVLGRCNASTYTFDEAITITDFTTCSVPTTANMLKKIVGTPTYDQLDSLWSNIDDSLYSYIKPFIAKLPFEQRLEFRDMYGE